MGAMVRASVVTPTYNRKDSLLRVLDGLRGQTVPPDAFEVIVISDGSSDGTVDACRALDLPFALRVIEQPNQGPGAARNRGVAEARAELIVFLDDDVVPDPALLEEHLRAHEADPDVVSIGPLLPPPDAALQPWVRWEEQMLLKQYRDMDAGKYAATQRQFYTGNAAIRRALVLDNGGFDPSYARAEDIQLAYRLSLLGYGFVYLPRARGWHYARRSYRSWLAIPVAYGQCDVRMAAIPGLTYILENVFAEAHDRHGLVRVLGFAAAGRPRVVGIVSALLGACAWVGSLLPGRPGERAANAAFSIIFNTRYWHGIASAVGRDAFLRGVLSWRAADATAAPAAAPDPVAPDGAGY